MKIIEDLKSINDTAAEKIFTPETTSDDITKIEAY